MRRLNLLFVLALMALASACASSGGGGDDGPRRNANVISAEELDEVRQLSIYDAVQRLRPQWYRVRSATTGGEIKVFVNNVEMGSLDFMRGMQAAEVTRIIFRNGRDATTRYGTGYGAGTIEISTR